eukprot:Sspe_Gene.282::Locus_96_Transcript_2_2_Confidence_0.600_Length_2397::g.282::m.282/K11204/GCLC; glutamate--cysteine ligase catalytic subunit
MDENTQVDPLLNIDANPNNKYIKRYMDDSDDEVDEPAAKRPKMDKKELAEKARSDDLKPNVAQTMYFFGQYFDKQEDAKKALEVREFSEQAAHPSIYMDCMAFGMGCNCLQTTFQAQHIDQARHVYDQLAVLCPMMLALSAATPIHKGLLSEIDVRWAVISASVDDRKSNEVPRIMKSRYDTVSTYISTRPADEYFQHMNDIKLQIDERRSTSGFARRRSTTGWRGTSRTSSSATPWSSTPGGCTSLRMRGSRTTLRTSSQPTGRACASSPRPPRPPGRTSGGVWSSACWSASSPTSRTLHSWSSPSCWPGPSSPLTSTSTSPSQRSTSTRRRPTGAALC